MLALSFKLKTGRRISDVKGGGRFRRADGRVNVRCGSYLRIDQPSRERWSKRHVYTGDVRGKVGKGSTLKSPKVELMKSTHDSSRSKSH